MSGAPAQAESTPHKPAFAAQELLRRQGAASLLLDLQHRQETVPRLHRESRVAG